LFVRPDYLLIGYVILALITLSTSAISYGLALKVNNQGTLGQVINNVAQPTMLLSGTLLPIALAPLWLRDVALWNPFSWAATAMRSLFHNHAGDYHIWVSIGFVAALAAVTLTWSARVFARSVR
jgi:ABC-2 type transport system permease protein